MTGIRLDPLLTRQEVADILRVSTYTIDRMARRGDLRPLKSGQVVRYEPAEVRRWMRKAGK